MMDVDSNHDKRSRPTVLRKTREPPQIGARILNLRKRRHLTLEQVAEKSGISRSMLSQIERGAANPMRTWTFPANAISTAATAGCCSLGSVGTTTISAKP